MMRIFIAILFLSLVSCKEEKSLKTIKIVNKEEKSFKKIAQINKNENNFFETIDSVRLISFPSKMYWDKTKNFKEKFIPKDKIIDDLILNSEQLNEILEILKIDYKDECMEAACYEPRHMLQLYKNNKIIAFYEVCLECGNNQNSKNLNFLPPFCMQKGEELKSVFIKMKLKNRGEGSSVLNNLEK